MKLGLGSLPTGVNEGDNDETEIFINDDDGVGITVSATALTVDEGGSTTYTVVLASQPTADVTVTLVTTSGSDVSVNTSSLTFTASNWDDEQTVTVSAAQDDDHLDESATIAHAVNSDDNDYNGIHMASVGVTVIDDEDVPVTVHLRSGEPCCRRGERGDREGYPQRGPGAAGAHPPHQERAGRDYRRRLFGGARDSDLRRRRDGRDLHRDGGSGTQWTTTMSR